MFKDLLEGEDGLFAHHQDLLTTGSWCFHETRNLSGDLQFGSCWLADRDRVNRTTSILLALPMVATLVWLIMLLANWKAKTKDDSWVDDF